MFCNNLSAPSSEVKKSNSENSGLQLSENLSFYGWWGLCPSNFLKKQNVLEAGSLSGFSQRSAWPGVLLDWAILNHRHSNVLQCHQWTNLVHNVTNEQFLSVGSNRKVAIGKLKCTTRLKNKTWTNPEIKNHKKRHDLRLTWAQTQHHKNQITCTCI